MQHLSYFAKAYGGAVYAGLIYLMSVIAPAAHLSDITLVQWIGFASTIVGTWLGVAVITNGPKPVKADPAPADPAPAAPVTPPAA